MANPVAQTQAAAQPNREKIPIGPWTDGINSMLPPYEIKPVEYAWAENILNRGGIPQTRPGFRWIVGILGNPKFETHTLQGFCMFTPTDGTTQMLVAVDGLIFYATAPYTEFTQITGATFDPYVNFVHMHEALKSVTEDATGVISELPIPKELVIIQDGINKPVSWDGTIAKIIKIQIGTWMEWTNSRLWVASGSRLYASNLADPEHFTEGNYLAERSSFMLPDNITGMTMTPDLTGLLVFTSENTFSFQSGIRDRTQWQATPNFQQMVLVHIGCIAGRSIFFQNGMIYWFSSNGLVSFNAATQSAVSSIIPTTDGQMLRSKAHISDDASGVCCTSFQNLLLVSVPNCDRYNSHTWVKDFSAMGEAEELRTTYMSNPQLMYGVWSAVWTGIRPVEYATVVLSGTQKCFAASYDISPRDGIQINIWELFDPNKEDNNYGRITCTFETGMIPLPSRRKFWYAEIDLVEISGQVDLQIYFGGIKGPWIKCFDGTLLAQEGSLRQIGEGQLGTPNLTLDTIIEEYKPQSRRIRTRDFSAQTHYPIKESGDVAGVDKAFGLLLVWQGKMGVNFIKIATSEFPESDTGVANTIETVANAIDMGGNQL